MTLAAQALHVAAKDLRQTKWMVLTYVGLTALLTAIVSGVVGIPATSVGLFSILLFPVGILLAAVIVQSDSPSRADAFWVSRPLASSAVIVAKALAIAASVIVPGVIGQVVALDAFSVPTADIIRITATSAGLYAVILLITVAVAALTPDLKAFVVVAVAGMVSVLTAQSFIPVLDGRPISTTVTRIWTLYPPIVCTLVIGYEYATRNTIRSRLAAVIAAAMLLAIPRSNTVIGVDDRTGMTAGAPLTVAAVWIPSDTNSKRIRVRLDIPPAPPGSRVVARYANARLNYPDGRPDPLVSEAGTVVLNDPQITGGPSVRSIVGRLPRSDSMEFGFRLTDAQAAVIARGGVQLSIGGEVDVQDARLLATLDTRPGATSGSPWTRFEYQKTVPGNPMIGPWSSVIDRVVIEGGPEDPFSGSQVPRDVYVLVNEQRGESAGNAVRSGSSTNDVLLPLPGATAQASRLSIGVDRPDERTPSPLIDSEWIRGAKLEVFRWTTNRFYPVNIVLDSRQIERRP